MTQSSLWNDSLSDSLSWIYIGKFDPLLKVDCSQDTGVSYAHFHSIISANIQVLANLNQNTVYNKANNVKPR